jgi:hypothetical protein
MITEASGLAGSGAAAVLGCGHCGEIPLRLLNQTFELVDLVDIDEHALAAVKRQCKQWNDEENAYRFHRADLTGMIARVERRAGELVAKMVDSSQCLDQLGILLETTPTKLWVPPRKQRYDIVIHSLDLKQIPRAVSGTRSGIVNS